MRYYSNWNWLRFISRMVRPHSFPRVPLPAAIGSEIWTNECEPIWLDQYYQFYAMLSVSDFRCIAHLPDPFYPFKEMVIRYVYQRHIKMTLKTFQGPCHTHEFHSTAQGRGWWWFYFSYLFHIPGTNSSH